MGRGLLRRINWGWGVITAITNTTTATVDIERTVTVTTGETKWRLGSWSSVTGYPSTGAFFEQRLYAAGNTDQPQTFWASQTGDFENHSPDSDPTVGTHDGTVQDDDALDFTISADSAVASWQHRFIYPKSKKKNTRVWFYF